MIADDAGMATFEKLGIVMIAWALKWDLLDKYDIPLCSTATLAVGSLLVIGGEQIEAWLRRRFPNIDW